ncbi:MAG TPA: hypothetical protein VNQ90_04745 [Chthoniobacteraceae bacterium]|nr:hypothetical protein [Chthoniobacteraceae bacterium]
MKTSPPTKSEKITLSLPEAIAEMAKIRKEKEGYPSMSAYVAGLILFDYYCGRAHWLTARLMRESREMRDLVIQEILENPGRETSWIDHVIEEKVKEAMKEKEGK